MTRDDMPAPEDKVDENPSQGIYSYFVSMNFSFFSLI